MLIIKYCFLSLKFAQNRYFNSYGTNTVFMWRESSEQLGMPSESGSSRHRDCSAHVADNEPQCRIWVTYTVKIWARRLRARSEMQTNGEKLTEAELALRLFILGRQSLRSWPPGMISHQRGSYSTRTVFNTVHILLLYYGLVPFGRLSFSPQHRPW